jgi:DNA-binding GntR family transcriptional regulator
LLEGPIILSSLSEEVYKRLRLSLFQNLYQPGEQLDIGQIASNLNVSKQPIKDAINRLSQEGLVEIRQRVGTFVRKFNRADVRNIMDARRMFEIFAVTNATLDEESLRMLETQVERMEHLIEEGSFDYLSFNEADHRFHKLLVGLSRNEILVNMYVQLNAHYVAARAFYANAFERTMTGKGSHRKILSHLQLGDVDEAIAELEKHIDRAKSGLMKIFGD